tara:strand:- start:448 stop:585 length:138 start_codon:yes stop_codon:yes gene_type:complete
MKDAVAEKNRIVAVSIFQLLSGLPAFPPQFKVEIKLTLEEGDCFL